MKDIVQLGLIGHPLSHSFSKKYFEEKFRTEQIPNVRYELYDLESLDQFPELIRNTPGLAGLNVTIPYKEKIIPYLDSLDEDTSARIGAVNTISIRADGSMVGFNTDYHGFLNSLTAWFDRHGEDIGTISALVLGTGGASKAVLAALDDLKVKHISVSRTAKEGSLSYEQLTPDILQEFKLCINTTPLGMYPGINNFPPIPYDLVDYSSWLYDLVYNPQMTEFLRKGAAHGAKTLGGLEMLTLQAEKAWEIWRDNISQNP